MHTPSRLRIILALLLLSLTTSLRAGEHSAKQAMELPTIRVESALHATRTGLTTVVIRSKASPQTQAPRETKPLRIDGIRYRIKGHSSVASFVDYALGFK